MSPHDRPLTLLHSGILSRSAFKGVLAALLLLTSTTARAQAVPLELVANPDGRWYEYFSDVFAQVDGGPTYPGGPSGADGMYLISALPSFTTIGGGATVFPFGADFGEVGDVLLDLSGVTGVGVETAPVTGLSIEFAEFIADDDALTAQPYASSLSNVTGTATLVDGVVTDVDFTSDVSFAYDFSGFGLGVLTFDGTFGVEDGTFSLLVDPAGYPTPFGEIRYVWDVDGAAAVPEPGATAGLFAGVAALAAGSRARRREVSR